MVVVLLLKQEIYNGMRYKRCKADEQQPEEDEEKNNKCKCNFSKEIFFFTKFTFFKSKCFFLIVH